MCVLVSVALRAENERGESPKASMWWFDLISCLVDIIEPYFSSENMNKGFSIKIFQLGSFSDKLCIQAMYKTKTEIFVKPQDGTQKSNMKFLDELY